jgi:hypothetical protein
MGTRVNREIFAVERPQHGWQANLPRVERMLTTDLSSTRAREGRQLRGYGLEPDSGNPTVRDHRGALGNTGTDELGTRSAIERAEIGNSHPTAVSALSFYPDGCSRQGCESKEVKVLCRQLPESDG